MPSLSRRRERDARADRFESQIRTPELLDPKFAEKRKFMCSGCGYMFEERSKVCPRCDKKTMGELKPIPEQHLAEAQRNAVRRAKEGRSRHEWEPGR